MRYLSISVPLTGMLLNMPWDLLSDPLRTSKGHLSLKALRLTPKMMKLYAQHDFSPDK